MSRCYLSPSPSLSSRPPAGQPGSGARTTKRTTANGLAPSARLASRLACSQGRTRAPPGFLRAWPIFRAPQSPPSCGRLRTRPRRGFGAARFSLRVSCLLWQILRPESPMLGCPHRRSDPGMPFGPRPLLVQPSARHSSSWTESPRRLVTHRSALDDVRGTGRPTDGGVHVKVCRT